MSTFTPNTIAGTNSPISSLEAVPTSGSFQSLLSRSHSCRGRKPRNWEAPRGHVRSRKAGNVWSCLCCTQHSGAQRAATGKEIRVTNGMGGINRKLGWVHLKASQQGNSVFQGAGLFLGYGSVAALARGNDGTQAAWSLFPNLSSAPRNCSRG